MEDGHKRISGAENGALSFVKLEAPMLAPVFKERPMECNKGDFGYVALMGGSLMYSGAVRLAAMANAAMRSGAGVATVAAPKLICPLIAPQILEATLYPLPCDEEGFVSFGEEALSGLMRRYDVIAVGMGLGNTEGTKLCLSRLLERYRGILVIDADGLNALARLGLNAAEESPARLVLTPHLKEFSRLSGLSEDEILKDKKKAAKDLAARTGAVVLLKGADTLITDGKRGFVSSTGCPGMATAGSGDVLSGIMAACCAACPEDLVLAASAAAFINGLAGEMAQKDHGAVSMTASDTAAKVEDAVKLVISSF
ncbi:MAG: NAD(P)H-hydrate dehydratase [Firmicutes bacterium]|nr:NAD(P)H-hydrate dehydratase [Bacillota bacterium]